MSTSLKHIFFVICIIGLSLVACSKLFSPLFYTSHDGEGHVIRMIEYDEAWKEGQIPVRIAKRINYGLGYPFFNFNYPLPYVVGEFFHLSGFSFVWSFKLLLVLSTIFAGISMYLFMLSHVGVISAFVSSTFYIFVPYRFLNMYVRGNPAESLALSLLPFLLWAIDRFIKTKGEKSGFLILFGSLFVLSHNTTVVVGLPLLFLYAGSVWYRSSDRKLLLKRLLFPSLSISLITSFFWVPVIAETGLTKLSELSEDYPMFFPTFREVLYSPWGFGAFKQGIFPGKMSPQIGILHIGILLVSMVWFIFLSVRNKIQWKRDWVLIFFIVTTLTSIFFMLPVSKFVWDVVPLLRMVQIPWRFLGLGTLGCSVLAGYLMNAIHIRQSFKYIGCVITLLMLFYVNRNHIRVNLYTEFISPFSRAPTYGFSTTSKDEHMPRLAPRIHENPNPNGDVIPPDSGMSERLVWRSNYQEFNIDASQPLEFRANVSYFPGWSAVLDGKRVPILYNKDEYQRLRIEVLSGTHKVIFRFGEPWYRLLADIVSLGTAVYLIGMTFWNKRKII